MSELIKLRPEVQRFAELMEIRLRENEHKSGWNTTPPERLFLRAVEEMGEAAHVIHENGCQHEVQTELSDVANFLMFICFVSGCLTEDAISEFASGNSDEDYGDGNIEISLPDCNNPFDLILITGGETIKRKFTQEEFIETINSAVSSAEEEDNA